MDGGNRRILVASTLLAIPAALLMASFSIGTPPGSKVELAVGGAGQAEGQVKQVVGKQPKGRSSSRAMGLFRALAGETSGSSHNHKHSTHNHSTHNQRQTTQPRGLLDGLFNGSSQTKRSSSSASSRSRSHSPHSAPRSNSGQADWAGIPYHRVDGSVRTSSRAPIQDPSSAGRTNVQDLRETGRKTASSGTRIIRGGSSRTIQAQPVSVRQQPILTRNPAPTLTAPRTSLTAESRSPVLSGSNSSRRSGRKSLQALDASEIAAAARRPVAIAVESDDLVPKVVRKEVSEKESEKVEAEPKVATKPARKPKAFAPEAKPIQEEAADLVAKKDLPTSPEPELAPAPEKSPTALATIAGAKESVESEPPSAADLGTPSSTLAPPKPAPAYTKPVDPRKQPVPVAGIPNHPYAASTPPGTPSLPIAHRSGPPASAFGAAPLAAEDLQPPYNANSAPVGSGVAGGGVASHRTPAPPAYPPAAPYQANQPQLQGPALPGAANPPNTLPPNRMSTHGQPVMTAPERVAARPPQETATIPMQPIDGYRQGPAPATDAFATSTFDERNNRMRSGAASGAIGLTAVASELPGIRVVTNGPGEIMIRQTSQYEIRVENRGSIDAEGVMVRANVPDWADLRGQHATRGDIDTQTQGSVERLVWTIDQLPAGASEQMFVRLKAERSGTYGLDVDWTLVPQKSVAKVHVHEPKLDLSIDGPDEVVYGQSQTYKVRVLNPGDGTAPNVVFTLSPNSATPQTQRIGDIPPGKEAQFEVELTAQDLGDLKIHGLAAGDLELRAEAAKTIRVAAAKLEAMLSGPELKYQNTESVYNLQVQNTGAATSEKIAATLRLPVGVQYTGGIEEAQQRGHNLQWEIDSLAPGATRNYQFRCNMAATGEHLFAFDCKGTAAGNTDVSISTKVESIADLVLSISDPAAPAPIGTDVTYEIVVRNRGSKEATDVLAVALFSHGIEPQRVEGQSGEVVTGKVLFDTIPRIGPGQEVRMKVIAKAERAGHHRFRTEIRSGDTVLVAEEATHYMSPTSERVSRRSTDTDAR